MSYSFGVLIWVKCDARARLWKRLRARIDYSGYAVNIHSREITFVYNRNLKGKYLEVFEMPLNDFVDERG